MDQIEFHQIDMKYEHTRIRSKSVIQKLANSLMKYGQREPVLLLKGETPILIDGYKRIKALKKLGQDTALSRRFDGDEVEALIHLLNQKGGGSLDFLEESYLYEELRGMGLSLSSIGQKTGRDKSHIKRRLDLLHELPEEIQNAIMKGRISTWSASRILLPLARANKRHAQVITEYLVKEYVTSRDLKLFHEHYRVSAHEVREMLVRDPGLYFRTCLGIAKTKKKLNGMVDELQGIEPDAGIVKELRAIRRVVTKLIGGIDAEKRGSGIDPGTRIKREKSDRDCQDPECGPQDSQADLVESGRQGAA